MGVEVVSDIKGRTHTEVFEKRVLRRIFEPKMNEMTGGCRKLHNAELRDLNTSPIITTIIKSRRRMSGACERMGEKRNTYRLGWEKEERGRDH
jgi:hypothetical protein